MLNDVTISTESKDKESEDTDDDTDCGAAHDITDEVYARQDPCQSDGGRQTQHDDAEVDVDIKKCHRDDKRAHGMTRGKALSRGFFLDGGRVIVYFIRSLRVDDRPNHRDQDQCTKRDERESKEQLAADPFIDR